ncbi:CoA transferase [Parafrankia sp. Ea1.12]|uniref:CoA transferase n=1 Tax=Parafrankia sp. Ea1.12 TaxID=573499 RepID=UPI000DD3E5F2|nr:CoA transferase [Parafrankia sp. Ea1.12]
MARNRAADLGPADAEIDADADADAEAEAEAELEVELRQALLAAGLPLESLPLESLPFEAAPFEARPTAAPAARPALDWAGSGLMWLTGRPAAVPVVPDAPVLGRARAAAALLRAASAQLGAAVEVDVPELLAGRAALLGLRRGGTISANGGCRLLRAADGWVAVNLARRDDVEMLPALLGVDPAEVTAPAGGHRDPLETTWAALTALLPAHDRADLVDRAWLLGLPVASLPSAEPAEPRPPVRIAVQGIAVQSEVPGRQGEAAGPAAVGNGAGCPLVVDLSSLWAGPLAARLLGRMGLRVVKVESVHRPDGARLGDPDFYRWLHAGQDEERFDFTDPRGRAALHRLVERADVVIEGSRPRALAQLGLDADRWVRARSGRVWLSITGYGRAAGAGGHGPGPVAFGDDAAVAGGLVGWDRTAPGGSVPVFCGDAIADPLTGLFGALAVALCRAAGRGALLDVAMRDVAAFVAAPRVRGRGLSDPGRRWGEGPWSVTGSDELGWTVRQSGAQGRVLAPRRPRLPG